MQNIGLNLVLSPYFCYVSIHCLFDLNSFSILPLFPTNEIYFRFAIVLNSTKMYIDQGSLHGQACLVCLILTIGAELTPPYILQNSFILFCILFFNIFTFFFFISSLGSLKFRCTSFND